MVSAEELRKQGAIVGGKREFIGRLREKIGAVQRRSPSDFNRAKVRQLEQQIASETAEVERLEKGFEQKTGVPGSVQYSYRPRDFRGDRAKNIDRSQRGRTGIKFSQPKSLTGGGQVTATGTSRTSLRQQPVQVKQSRDKFLLDPRGGVQEDNGYVYVPLEQVEGQLRARQHFIQEVYVAGSQSRREGIATEQRISKIQGFLFPPGVKEDVQVLTGKSRRELATSLDMRTYADRQVFDISRSKPGKISTGLKKRANVFFSDPVGSAIDTSKVAVVSAATGAGTGAVFKVGGTMLATRYGVGIARSAYQGAQIGMGAGFAGSIGVSAYTDPEGFGYQAPDLVIGGVGFMKGFKGTAPTRTVTTRMPQQVKTTETFIDLPGGQIKTTGKGRAFVEVKEFGQTTVAVPEVTVTATQPFVVQGKQTTPVRVSVRGGTDLVSFNRDFAGYARFNEATGQTRYALTAGVGKTRTTVDILQSKPIETTLRPGEESSVASFQSQTFVGSAKPQALTPFEGVSRTDRISYTGVNLGAVVTGKGKAIGRVYEFRQSPIARGGGAGKGTVVVRGAVRTGYEPYTLLPEQQPTYQALQPVKGFESFSLLQEKGLYKEPVSTRARGKFSGLREQVSTSLFPKNIKRLYSGVGLERVEPVRPGKITQPQGTFGKTPRAPFPVAGMIAPAQYAKLGSIGVFAFGQKSAPGAKYSVSRGTYALTTPRSTKPTGKQGKKQIPMTRSITSTSSKTKGVFDFFNTGRTGGGGQSLNFLGPPPSKVPPPPPAFGALPLFGRPSGSKKRGKGRKRGFEYRPSLVAGVLNIKGSKSTGALTGLEIRPL